MSSFMINITPPIAKNKTQTEAKEPTPVVMAPFSAKATVMFENVPVMKTARRVLNIQNPSGDLIEVTAMNSVDEVSLCWTSHTVPPHGEVELELKWTPSMEMSRKETLEFVDNRNFKKCVFIVKKSVSAKTCPRVKQFPAISSSFNQSKVFRQKQPINASSRPSNQQKKIRFKTERSSPLLMKKPPRRQKTPPLTESNAVKVAVNPPTPKSSHFPRLPSTSTSTAIRFKENVSPPTPGNIMDKIDQLKFTPASDISSIELHENNRYFSNLPTPVSHSASARITRGPERRHEIQPRKINVLLSEDEMSPTVSHFAMPTVKEEESSNDRLCHTTSICVVNKTFEVKSVDANWKRDVSLIGTPLRKCSESMRDLSMNSTKSKYLNQGSMPNLSDMESINSIEHNRYFQMPHRAQSKSAISPTSLTKPCLPVEPLFDDNEILAQSSRYNLNEIEKMEVDNTSQVNLDATNLSEEKVFKTPRSLCSIPPSKSNKKRITDNEILAQSSRYNLNEIEKMEGDNISQMNLDATHLSEEKVFKTPRSLCASSPSTSNKKRIRSSLDSPTTNSINLQVPKSGVTDISPPKKAKIDFDSSVYGSSSTNRSQKMVRKPKLSRVLSLKKKPVTPHKFTSGPVIKLYNTDSFMQTYINPDPFAASTTIDPFLASTMYLDEQTVEKHQIAFRKWLNALVSIPSDLAADCNQKLDVGRLFNEVCNKDLILAPSREQRSLNYLTKFRLETLRQEAIRLYMSKEMQDPCSKIAVYVHKKVVRIRDDRNLHLDVVMQRQVLELLLNFNPVWLRLGLEVVFAEKIHLNSCSDVYGLSAFIINRLFRDRILEQRYSRAYCLSDEYAEHIKKFTLQMMLLLLLFLDKAKTKRIIKHNPCLFVRNAEYKEVRQVLLKFSRELLANVGDITRDLKRLGYELTHKQTFLDEFDYAFNNLAVDLRDGIRLSRVMEIILLRDDLTMKLRVPAISRLQKLFNVNLSLGALAEADFQLYGNITAADIVDGHREKTLSLLWQIIYKFRSPKFHEAATTIQRWWRHCWLYVIIRRRIKTKIELRRNNAATRIQKAFRGYISRKYAKVYRRERTAAALCMQKYVRRYIAQKHLHLAINGIVCIQRWYRRCKHRDQARQAFVRLRTNAIVIQRWFRRLSLARKIEALPLIIMSIRAEVQFRHEKATIIQRYLKSWVIRSKFRRCVHQVVEQIRITSFRNRSAAKIQAFFKMILVRQQYHRKQKAALTVQHFWQSYLQKRAARHTFLELQKSAIIIQRRYRANQLKKKERGAFLELRQCVVKLQQQIRAKQEGALQRKRYLAIKKATVLIQQRYRATQLMRKIQTNYKQQKQVIINCQRRFRATRCMRDQCFQYNQMRSAAISIQRHFRNYTLKKSKRVEFQKIRHYARVVQQRFRAKLLTRKLQSDYKNLLRVTITIQKRYRATRLMQLERHAYQSKRRSAVKIQQWIRATNLMKTERLKFQCLRQATIAVQRRFKATLAMRVDRAKYQRQRFSIIVIQRRLRAHLLMKTHREHFNRQRQAITTIKKWYGMIRVRSHYKAMRTSIILVQRRWRAKLEGRTERTKYKHLLQCAILIQRRFRANLAMRIQRADYQHQKTAITFLQRRYRARLEMVRVRENYLDLRSRVIFVQRKFRATRAMKTERDEFLELRRAAKCIQRFYRRHLETVATRKKFTYIVKTILNLQAYARGYLVRRNFYEVVAPEIRARNAQKKAAITIQRSWRGYRVRKRWQNARIITIRNNVKLLKSTYNALNSVKCRVRESVCSLKDRFLAVDALNILLRFDRISRTIPHVLVDDAAFISTFCYGVMSQAIRSEFDKQLLEACSRVILNLSRYKGTKAGAFQEHGLTTIAQILMRWCGKDCDIFNILCTLIWVMAHCPQKREAIRKYMTTQEAIYMVRETKKLVARKEKMKKNIRKPQNQPESARAHQQGILFSSKAVPSFEPDFGVIRKRPYIFVSSVFAFETVLQKLNINVISC